MFLLCSYRSPCTVEIWDGPGKLLLEGAVTPRRLAMELEAMEFLLGAVVLKNAAMQGQVNALEECAAFLPGKSDLILLKYGIMADQVSTLHIGLGNQHAVERIFVVVGQALQCEDVWQEDG